MNEADIITVPTEVSRCPECCSQLVVDGLDIDCETGLPLASSISVSCTSEDFEDKDTYHRHWQSEWQPVIDEVKAYLIREALIIAD